ncbi:MAG: ribosome recycling factor [Candidatus Neomarinimicrobiota bacterium]|nr:ribosome recycling factor [Candidatus Neomarinimicrobiota bacterium]|tara:strand:- start:1298 stop:1855 length:558 start_codon:yes stop_codon:yes gene_type:complete
MIKDIINDTIHRMDQAVAHTRTEMSKVRTGRANTELVESIKVSYYGTLTPLNQLSTISIPEPRLITIHPFDKSVIDEIEKAIMESNLGLTPNNNGEIILVPIPPLSEERRIDLTKYVHQLAEEGRVAVRNVRRDAIHHLRNLQKEDHISEDEIKRSETEIQNLTDNHVKTLNEIMESKEKEIMVV